MKTQILILSALLVASQSSNLLAQTGAPQLVSAIDSSMVPSASAGGDSRNPVISRDGLYVAFASTANNLTTIKGSVIPLNFPPVLNVYLKNRVNGMTTLISVNQAGTGGGNGNSIPKAVSPDGRYILFESDASDLVSVDNNAATDVFVRDTKTLTTLLVSSAPNGMSGAGPSDAASTTPDGRFVTFASSAPDLIDPTNSGRCVYVRDLQSNTLTLTSTNADAPTISPDGRYVLFTSAGKSGAEDVDIYLADRQQGTKTWLSREGRSIAQSAGIANTACTSPVLSSNSQFAVYQIANLVFRYSLSTGETILVSSNALKAGAFAEYATTLDVAADGSQIVFVGNTANNSQSIQLWSASTGSAESLTRDFSYPTQFGRPTFSGNGNAVGFLAGANEQFNLYVRDLDQGTNRVINTTFDKQTQPLSWYTQFALNTNGSAVVFDAASNAIVPNDRNSSYDVFVNDQPTEVNQLISAHDLLQSSISPNGLSAVTTQSVSSNGRRIAFTSTSENLVQNDKNQYRDVFVRDLDAETTVLVSIATNGLSANGQSYEPVISANGQFVAFTSLASDLAPGNYNKYSQVYVRDLASGSTLLVSGNAGVAGNNNSDMPQISSDGRFILFRSLAANLVAGSDSGLYKLYLKDVLKDQIYSLTSNTFSDAKMTPDGKYIVVAFGASYAGLVVWNAATMNIVYTNNVHAICCAISPDGRKVAYDQYTSFTDDSLIVTDLATKTSLTLGATPTLRFAARASLGFNAAGTKLICVTTPSTAAYQITLFDVDGTNPTVIASHAVNSSALGGGKSDMPQISPDGQYIAYRSSAPNLVAGGHSNGIPVIVLYSTVTGSNTLLSASTATNVNDRSTMPVFSGDGRTLVFQSWNNSLTKQNFHYGSDIYALPVSYLEASIAPTSGGLQLTWPQRAQANYTVQYVDTFGSTNWQTLQGNTFRQGSNCSIIDYNAKSSTRFYRVVEQ